jgi:hypothetical protein
MKTQSLAATVKAPFQPPHRKEAHVLSSTKKILALTALIWGAASVPASANDSAFEGITGSAKLLKASTPRFAWSAKPSFSRRKKTLFHARRFRV